MQASQVSPHSCSVSAAGFGPAHLQHVTPDRLASRESGPQQKNGFLPLVLYIDYSSLGSIDIGQQKADNGRQFLHIQKVPASKGDSGANTC